MKKVSDQKMRFSQNIPTLFWAAHRHNFARKTKNGQYLFYPLPPSNEISTFTDHSIPIIFIMKEAYDKRGKMNTGINECDAIFHSVRKKILGAFPRCSLQRINWMGNVGVMNFSSPRNIAGFYPVLQKTNEIQLLNEEEILFSCILAENCLNMRETGL